ELRRRFLGIIFDNETSQIPKDLRNEFLTEVTAENYPLYLNFHKGNWFAEVGTIFTYQGTREPVTLFMKLQPEGLGFELVIDMVSVSTFNADFHKAEGSAKEFLLPLSNEVGFMNLRKALQDNKQPESYTPNEFKQDFLTLFLYEITKR